MDGDSFAYSIRDGSASEIGYGTVSVSGNVYTLTRTPRKSTNADAVISLSGNAIVSSTPSAEDLQRDIALGDGTAAAPSLAFESDDDTGLYRIGANNAGFSVGGAGTGWGLSATAFYPITNDAWSLGKSGNAVADAYFATGAVFDFGTANAVITHSSGILTVSTGDWRITTAGSNSASAVTVGGTQTLTNKTLTSPAINTPTITAGTAAALTGLAIRSTGAAFDLTFATAEVLTAGRTLSFVLNDAARTINLGGNLTTAAAFVTSGAFSVTFTATNTTTVTLPLSGTLATLAGSEALSNKTIGNTNTVTLKDTLFTVQDDGDATKLLAFQLSGITTGNTRTWTVPDSSDTFVGKATTDILTNKTLTSPAINTATIIGGTATALTGLAIRSTGAAFDLTFATAEAISAGRTLSWVMGNAARTITLSGNPTLNDWFDQAVKAASSPQFTAIELSHASQNTLTGSSGILSIEGVAIPTISSTDVLSNKTLTAAKIANAGFLADANGNEHIIFTTTASAVNEITYANAATGNNPSITASGETNVSLSIAGKGTGGVILGGTSTNDSAAVGKVGQIIESSVASGSAVGLTTNTAANVTSISLTAGDWDVWGVVGFTAGGATTSSDLRAWMHTTSASEPTTPNSGGFCQFISSMTFGNNAHIPAGQMRISLSATTTVYLGTKCGFAVSTLSAFGYIGARRVR